MSRPCMKDNGYQLMFLSSRAISQSNGTRRYLEKLTQDGETLTQGPVMLAPDPFSTALYREAVTRRPQVGPGKHYLLRHRQSL